MNEDCKCSVKDCAKCKEPYSWFNYLNDKLKVTKWVFPAGITVSILAVVFICKNFSCENTNRIKDIQSAPAKQSLEVRVSSLDKKNNLLFAEKVTDNNFRRSDCFWLRVFSIGAILLIILIFFNSFVSRERRWMQFYLDDKELDVTGLKEKIANLKREKEKLEKSQSDKKDS